MKRLSEAIGLTVAEIYSADSATVQSLFAAQDVWDEMIRAMQKKA